MKGKKSYYLLVLVIDVTETIINNKIVFLKEKPTRQSVLHEAQAFDPQKLNKIKSLMIQELPKELQSKPRHFKEPEKIPWKSAKISYRI